MCSVDVVVVFKIHWFPCKHELVAVKLKLKRYNLDTNFNCDLDEIMII